MVSLLSSRLPFLFLLSIFVATAPARGNLIFNVTEFGAAPDGITSSTEPFLQAWAAACNASEAATLYVGGGPYLLHYTEFTGPCRSMITVQINGTIVAPMNLNSPNNSSYWIVFRRVDGLLIEGGILDAKGDGYWECKMSGGDCTAGARSLTLNSVDNGRISGLTSINSQQTHVVINSCNNVTMSDLKIIAPEHSPNTDGIHVQSSNRTVITNCDIETGDDCIAIGPGTRDLWMENINCGPGHGVSIGSLGRRLEEDGVENVTLLNSTFIGSDNGLRIKTWARPSNGFVTNITYQNIVMTNVNNPIIIDQNYCPSHRGCPNETSGIEIRNVAYDNIAGTSATEVAMAFDCSPTHPCTAITLRDIKLTYLNTTTAQSLCNNINGTSDGVILPDDCFLSAHP